MILTLIVSPPSGEEHSLWSVVCGFRVGPPPCGEGLSFDNVSRVPYQYPPPFARTLPKGGISEFRIGLPLRGRGPLLENAS